MAGLLWPRPFPQQLSNALVSRKFCERHRYNIISEDTIPSVSVPRLLYFVLYGKRGQTVFVAQHEKDWEGNREEVAMIT